jgi:hypothetical protein
MSPRRSEPRKTSISRISVAWEDQDGCPVNQTGLLEDRSRSGVGISVHAPIPVGTKVKIRGRVRELAGIVRHCRLHGEEYLVGLWLDKEDLSWKRFGAGL